MPDQRHAEWELEKAISDTGYGKEGNSLDPHQQESEDRNSTDGDICIFYSVAAKYYSCRKNSFLSLSRGVGKD
jgi:hypothetical protein